MDALASIQPIPAPAPEQPNVAEALRKVARTLDDLGALVLHLADQADHQTDDDPLLTVAQAAAELRCSESHVRSACAAGRIAAMRQGGWRMRRSALRTYERRNTQGG